MALIFLNQSICAVCGKPLTDHDDIIGLPPISDTANPLYPYFDQGLHKLCFESWDKREEVQAILKSEQEEYKKSDYYNEMLSKYGKPK